MASMASSVLASVILYIALVLWCARSSNVGNDLFDGEWGHFGAHPSYSSNRFLLEENIVLGRGSLEASGPWTSYAIGATSTGSSTSSSEIKVVSVDKYAAKADAKTDDTLAFEKAWKEACSADKGAVLVVPNKSYLIGPIRFSGPCQSNIVMQIDGNIKASDNQSDYEKDRRHWIMFENVANLVVDGGGSGTIDGNGRNWWLSSCKINESLQCKSAPTAMTLYRCNNSRVRNLKIQNAQQIHTSIEKCNNVGVSHLQVTAPGNSPNTDGIHITNSRSIYISRCIIRTGDDCISIVNGSQNVQATNITCGPGHGISIGSLGSDNSEAYVSGVTITGAKLQGTTNGVRIKTWQGGSGSASHIYFKNIQMQNVSNPIIIDQNYCDQSTPCEEQKSAVQVTDVVYENISGTSASDVAINLDCSRSHPCRGITLRDVGLKTVEGAAARATCNNVGFYGIQDVSPRCPIF